MDQSKKFPQRKVDDEAVESEDEANRAAPSLAAHLLALACQFLFYGGFVMLIGGIVRWPAGEPAAIAGVVSLGLWVVAAARLRSELKQQNGAGTPSS
jgi:succinate-acetate transporter protein